MAQTTRTQNNETPAEVFQNELQASRKAYDAAQGSIELSEHRLSELGQSFIEKVSLAKEILGTDNLHPKILEAIVIDDDDHFTRNNKTYPVTVGQLRELFDKGVIGEGTTPGFTACTPYDLNKGYAPLPGIDPALDQSELFLRVAQSGVGFSFDVPLISDGFSQCHAAIICDHETGQAALLHVMRWDADPGQVERVNEVWPHKGERELIYVYGSGSREDHSQYLAEATGATKVRRIKIATAASHWGLSYDPKTNQISVFRKIPSDVLTYPGISTEVYDEQRRAENSLERRYTEKILLAVHQAFRNPSWGEKNGEYKEVDLIELTKQVNKFTKAGLTHQQLKDFLLEQGLAYDRGEVCIIPAGFYKIEPERDEELHGIYDRAEEFARIRFHDYREAGDFYHKLIIRFGADLQCSDTFCSLIQRDGEEVGIMGGSGTEIRFRVTGDVRSELYHDILSVAQELRDETGYKLYFDSGLGYSSDDKISSPQPAIIEQWEFVKELRNK